MITDRKALEEAMMASVGGANLQQQQAMMAGGKDYNGIFKAEKENYEILNWKFELEDVEDALIIKYKGGLNEDNHIMKS